MQPLKGCHQSARPRRSAALDPMVAGGMRFSPCAAVRLSTRLKQPVIVPGASRSSTPSLVRRPGSATRPASVWPSAERSAPFGHSVPARSASAVGSAAVVLSSAVVISLPTEKLRAQRLRTVMPPCDTTLGKPSRPISWRRCELPTAPT